MIDICNDRILLLDGAMGTVIQRYGLTESDYKGERFRDIPVELKGCHDILCLTRPDVIGSIHRDYLEAGADIITTNSFNSNAISLADYGLSDLSYEMAREAAMLARKAADEYCARFPERRRYVAGTIGPTNKTASMSSDIMDPGARDVTYEELRDAYAVQIKGLLDGGADLILIETVFDTLNAKAALSAVHDIEKQTGNKIPIIISATVTDASGRTLSGQTIEAFYTSVAHAGPLAVGLNCAFGPDLIRPYVKRLADIADCAVSCHPNAGLPNAMGEYDETPASFALKIKAILEDGTVNVIGGCCGTTPDHIREIAKIAGDFAPRKKASRKPGLRVSGLEHLAVSHESNFVNIGERTNVAGSAKFARLIREGNYAEAVSIARRQVEAGAQIIDVCMDAPLIDAPEAMRRFLNLIAAEPEIARVPVMIDSSDWNVIEAGLRSCQGKCIVNSISLKEGEKAFLEKADKIRSYGAAAVVMLFDEKGQADTYERKIEVAGRSYRLLVDSGFPAEDIIFDPNVLTVATGIPEHDRYALDFIRTVAWIKENLPHAGVSGGISNLSFAFRGNNVVREAMHSAFLYHAIQAGLDMAIVNPQMLKVYSDIDPELLERVEDLLLMRRPDASERLLEIASRALEAKDLPAEEKSRAAELTSAEKLRHNLLKGIEEDIDALLDEISPDYSSGLEIIEKVLMPVMDEIGLLFGEGKMFLPQVIKSARVLKKAISHIAPAIEGESAVPAGHGKVLIATVRGDIHDIGKNIVSLVTACNGYEVADLGVMVDASAIREAAERENPVAVMLSGLITPSLAEMEEVCRQLEKAGLDIPVIVGGATTSPLHTALKLAPLYRGIVLHAPDASYNSRYLSRLLSEERESFINETRKSQLKLREDYLNSQASKEAPLPIEEARKIGRENCSFVSGLKSSGNFIFTDYPISEVEKFIDWKAFASGWSVKDKEEAARLEAEGRELLQTVKENSLLKLQGVAAIYTAHSENEDIVIDTPDGDVRFSMPRKLSGKGKGECVADLLPPSGGRVCLFAVTGGVGLGRLAEDLRREGNDYDAIAAKLLADRLTEAFAEKLQSIVESDSASRGLRLAFGYPSMPDHEMKRDVFEVLKVESHTRMRLTGNAMISPEESVCGIIF